jgi:ankyrin repeat protein
LLAEGADVAAATNARRCQPIHHAIRPSSSLSLGVADPWQASDAQRVAVVRALLKAGADPMAPANERWTPLHDAVSAGNLEMVKLLLDAGADPDAASERGTRPLHLDAFPNGLAIARLLVERGASVEVGPAPEVAFIHTAASRGDIDLVAFYLEKELPVDLAGGGGRLQPIHDAAESGQVEMVEFLLARGAKIDAPTFTRKQPLHLAAGRGWVKLVRFLLDRGADPDAVDSHGRTPAGWARAQNQAACVAVLEGGKPGPESGK